MGYRSEHDVSRDLREGNIVSSILRVPTGVYGVWYQIVS